MARWAPLSTLRICYGSPKSLCPLPLPHYSVPAFGLVALAFYKLWVLPVGDARSISLYLVAPLGFAALIATLRRRPARVQATALLFLVTIGFCVLLGELGLIVSEAYWQIQSERYPA